MTTTHSLRQTAVVVIPTRNEEHTIRGVIAEVREAFAGLPYDVEILITDDSTDATRAIAIATPSAALPPPTTTTSTPAKNGPSHSAQ